ncbi:glycoside hydrolase [Amylocystis lapponica]|nr:glycoside hydrolase [Amylocystis lapponica]
MLSLRRLLLLSCLAVLVEAQQCRLVKWQDLVEGTASASHTITPTSTSAPTTQPSAVSNGTNTTVTPFKYGTDIIRGVNLGGWFVLEPWITPSIFENTNNTNIVDEYTFGQMQNASQALAVLQNHWDTWITEDDFQAIKAAGLNHVRIPLGYWSVPITSADTNYTTSVSPYIAGAWPYLLRALNWAKDNSVHVILDLHGAPGSQNGFDNSGRRINSPAWASDADSVPRTLDIMRFIAKEIGGMLDVIELLNEPAGYVSAIGNEIGTYWQEGYHVVREASGNGSQVMIGDAFLGVQNWENFLQYPQAEGVIMDYHEYQIFNYEQLAFSYSAHIDASCQQIPALTAYAKSNLVTIIGEWSTAITDCAQWLNGRGVGARWDGTWQPNQQVFGSCAGFTGSMSNFSTSYKTFLRQYWESQVQIGESIQGWVYWAWKAENADDWSYQKGLEGGWIPQDPTDRMYPDICGSTAGT